jgi:hypothetical protein
MGVQFIRQGRLFGLSPVPGGGSERQPQQEGRALAAILQPEFSPVFTGDAPADGQSDTRTYATALGGKEGIENTLPQLFGHTQSLANTRTLMPVFTISPYPRNESILRHAGVFAISWEFGAKRAVFVNGAYYQ